MENRSETKSQKQSRVLIESLMGKMLDIGRMSDMGIRQFEQFERTTKNEFNNVVQYFKENFVLKEEQK